MFVKIPLNLFKSKISYFKSCISRSVFRVVVHVAFVINAVEIARTDYIAL